MIEAKHNGDLGHNATVCYQDAHYISDDGSPFWLPEVLLSDKIRYVYLTPGEALSLLDWLQQNREKLEQLAKEIL